MQADRTELHDLSTQHPDKLASLIRQCTAWAQQNGVSDWPPGEWPQWMNSEELRNN